MKKILIISTYPNYDFKLDTLDKCIDSLKPLNYDIMIVSHFPLPTHIQEKVKFYIYDSNNILLPPEYSTFNWLSNASFEIKINQRGHNLAILTNIKNGLTNAKLYGYEFFYFLESDNIFDVNEVEKLEDLRLLMDSNNKKMIFFNQSWNSNGRYHEIYETLIFGGSTDYFIENYSIPNDVDEYVNLFSKVTTDIKNITLELQFFLTLSNFKEEFLIIKKTTSDFFNRSIINKYSISSRFEIVSNNIDDSLILFLLNSSPSKITCKINSRTIELLPNYFYHESFKEDKTIEVFNESGEIIGKKEFLTSEYNKEIASRIGQMNFKK